MKIGNPPYREKVKLPKGAYVLDVGGGNNPNPRAQVVIDKYRESDAHRSGHLKVLRRQKFLEMDGEQMTFKDKEFDYVFCCQVLEHAEDPHALLSEISRVGKKGFLEMPSVVNEYLMPKVSHRWVGMDINGTLVLYSKEYLRFRHPLDLGELFGFYLPRHAVGFKILQRTHPGLFNIGFEWEGSVECVVNPDAEDLRRIAGGTWSAADCVRMVPPRPLWRGDLLAVRALVSILGSVFVSRILKR